MGSRAVHPEHLDDPDGVHELGVEPILEGDPTALDPAGDEYDLFVFDADTLDRPNALWEVKRLPARKRAVW